MRALLIALMSLTLWGGAPAEWSRKDTAMEGVFLGLLLADYMQTRQLIGDPKLYERNPILGERPQQQDINAYFAFVALGHVTVAMLLPAGAWRTTWQGVAIGIEAGAIANNYRLGVRIQW